MKIHLLDTDPRKNYDPYYNTNMGSFSIVSTSLNDGLKKIGCYAEPHYADWIGISDGLNFGFKAGDAKRFIVNVWDCINVLPNEMLYGQSVSKIQVIGLSNQITNLWRSYRVNAHTVMPGTDTDFWKPSRPKNDTFTFLFDSFANVRSGLDMAVKAYSMAFGARKDVKLLIKNTSDSKILDSKLASYQLRGFNIEFINKRLSFEEMRDIYSSVQVTLHVYRHSSWGLGVHQSAACGALPVVGDFCPSNEMVTNAIVPIKGEIEIQSILPELINEWGLHNAYGNFTYSEQPRFYDYNIEEYAKYLIDIYNNRDKLSSPTLRNEIINNWSLEKSAQNLVNILQGIDNEA